jgi:hypothetical protein
MNLQDPTQISLCVFIASFLFYILVLFLIKPSWVQIIDRKVGKLVISTQLLTTYSVTFALVTSILALLLASNYFFKPNELLPYSS